MTNIAKIVKNAAKKFGYEIRRTSDRFVYDVPVEFSERDRDILDYVLAKELTMASPHRLIATIQSARHAVEADIEGDFVECGVWRGGNSLAAKLVFEELGSAKHVYLFDTFAGMTPPTASDIEAGTAEHAKHFFEASQREDYNEWCFASLEDVQRNFTESKVNCDEVHFVKGDVLETLSDGANLPAKISVLRLDTDWYESTRKEMEVLYPRLSESGTLIVDDYGHWEGARKAIDEYFSNPAHGPRPLLAYTDHTGRLGTKPASATSNRLVQKPCR